MKQNDSSYELPGMANQKLLAFLMLSFSYFYSFIRGGENAVCCSLIANAKRCLNMTKRKKKKQKG